MLQYFIITPIWKSIIASWVEKDKVQVEQVIDAQENFRWMELELLF